MDVSKCILLLSLYSLDRLDSISKLLTSNKLHIDISVAIHHQDTPDLNKFLDRYHNRIKNIRFHQNYGVDIAPFLNQIYHLDPIEYPYFIKLHSKESFWGSKFHVDWGTVLIDTFIGKSFNLNMNLSKLQNKHIGMISHNFLKLNDRELNNNHKINFLCDILGLDYNVVGKGMFAAGSMFMSKTQIFQKYFNNQYKTIDALLSNEIGKVHDANQSGGTYSHSLERIFGYIITNENLRISNNINKTIPIFNAEYKKLHLVITYNNQCYLKEDMNIFGNIINNNDEKLTIQWLHLDTKPTVFYKYIHNQKLIRSM